MYRLKRSFILSILVSLTLLFSSLTSYGTDVGGTISSDTTWTLDGSPYVLTQSVLIQEGVTLTIKAGVEVRIGEGLGIRVDGAFIAQGTEKKKIIFTSAIGTTPGSWSTINFADTSPDATFDDDGNYTGGCILQYCRINYGGGTGAKGVIQINDSSPFIDHCEISDNKNEESGGSGGIWAQNAPDLRITDNTISENSASERGSGGGIYANDCTLTVSNNIISANSTSSGGYEANSGGIYADDCTLTISNNTISENSGYGGGIYANGGTITVSNNTISENSGGGGIDANGGTITISNNTISENSGYGGGIYANGGTITVSNNTISGNSGRDVGGIRVYAGGDITTVSNNIISGNSADGENGVGGIYALGRDVDGGIHAGGSTLTVSNNIISGNSSNGSKGVGGILIDARNGYTTTVSNNTISDNIAMGSCLTSAIHLTGEVPVTPITDTTPPALDSSTPAADATGVVPDDINTDGIVLEFSEAIDTQALEVQVVGTALAWRGSIDGKTVTLLPLPGAVVGYETEYTVAGTVVDVAGNETEVELAFTTMSKPEAPVSKPEAPVIIHLYEEKREAKESVRKLELNIIVNNHGGEGKRAIYIDDPNWTINNNAIYDNDVDYYLYYDGTGGTNLDATNNYWGTTGKDEILNGIYDFFDNSSRGMVTYIPFSTERDPGLPPLPPKGLTVEPITGGVKLAWNANTESGLAGYKLYYDTDPGTPYRGTGANQGKSPISVGNVTSYELTGLMAGQTYYFALTAVDTEDKESGSSSEVSVTFPVPEIASITISPDTATVEVERTHDFSVEGKDADGNTYPLLPTGVTWGIIGDIGTMDGNGTFTATEPGTGRIKAVLNPNTSVMDETGDITVPRPPPYIESVSPTHALAGQPVTITGRYFGSSQGDSTVIFGGVSTDEAAVSWSDTSITINIPSESFGGPIVVTVSSKRSKSVPFTVDNPITRIEDVRVTNLTSSSVTISWLTDGSAIGTVNYGPGTSLGSSASESTPGKIHWVRLTGLAPETTYYFEVATADLVDNNGGDYYSFKTSIIGFGNTYTTYGKVYKSSADPAGRAIVFLSLVREDTQSTVLSTLTDSHGYWLLDLGDLKNPVSGDVWNWSVGDRMRIEVQAGEDGMGFDESHAVSGTSSQNCGEISLGTAVIRHISLPRGLSLITLPLTHSPAYTSYTLIQDIQPCVKVARWQSDAQSWDSAIKAEGKVIGSEFEISNSAGYFVQANADTVLSLTGTRITIPITLSLVQGLNLIGTPATTGLSSYKLLSSLPDCEKVARWNDQWQSWESAILVDDSIIGSNFPIKDDDGCFVQMSSAVEWTPPIAPTAPSMELLAGPPDLLPLTTDKPLGEILDHLVSNVTSSSVTLSWSLDGMGDGVVCYGETPALEKDSDSRIHSALHAVKLTGLEPDTTYYYRIISRDGSKEVKTSLMTFRTSKVGAGETHTGYGRMLDYDGTPLAGKLVYLRAHGVESSLPLSCTTDSNGFWWFDLGNLKTADGEPFRYQPGDLLRLSVTADKPMLTAKIDRSGVQFIGDIVIPKSMAHVAGRPQNNELLQNFPNPFNPETWIPYKLSDEGNVTIEIYNLNGTPVRRLSLGHLKSDYYLTRDKAAYWDGRNELGETVASGVYFYVLKTDDFRAVRKMVVVR